MNTNLTNDISQLKNTIQKETTDLAQKESISRNSVTEQNSLTMVIKTKENLIKQKELDIKQKENEIKQKEIEIQRAKTEIQQSNNKMTTAKRNFGTVSTDIASLKRNQIMHAQDLRKLEVEQQDALRRNSSNKRSF